MKRIFNIALAFAALSFAAVSCAPEEQAHKPGAADLDGCYGVFFPKQEGTGDQVFAPTDPTTATFKVGRTVTDGKITVPVVVEATKGDNDAEIFEIEDIVFADGQAETTFDVDFPDAKEGVKYSLKMSIVDPEYVSTYTSAATTLNFSVLRVVYQYLMTEDGSQKSKVTFTQGWWEQVHTCYIKYYEVDGARYCTTESDIYYYEDDPETPEDESADPCYGFWGTGEELGDGELSFVWYTPDFEYVPEDPDEAGDFGPDVVKGKNGGYKVVRTLDDDTKAEGLNFEPSHIFNYQGSAANPVYALDYYHYWLSRGYDEEGIGGTWFWSFLSDDGCPVTGGYPLSYYDGHGGFYLNFKYYIPSLGGGFSADDYDVVGIAEGYTRVDYSLKAYAGYTDEGVVPVVFEAGADVAEIAYEVYEGELSANQAKGKGAEIAADKDAKKVDMDELGLEVSLEKSGLYTLVAISIDNKGKYTDKYAYVSFEYATSEDDASKDVKILVGTEDVSSRYASKGYDTTNSFGAYFCGEGVTELHYAIASTKNFEANTEVLALAVKSGAKGVTVVDGEDALKQLNTATGISDVFAGLDELTSYTVIVWATNGVKETMTVAQYTTSGIPADWKEVTTGTFVYGKGSFFCDYDEDDNEIPSYDHGLVLFNDANHTDRYMIEGCYYNIQFKFSVKADGSIVVPETYTGYLYSQYGADVNIVDMTMLYDEAILNEYYDDSFENYDGSHFDAAKKYFEFDVVYWSDMSDYMHDPNYAYYDWCYGPDYFVFDEGLEDFLAWFDPQEEEGDEEGKAGIGIEDWAVEQSGAGVTVGDWTVDTAAFKPKYLFSGKATGLDNGHEIMPARFSAKSADARSMKVVRSSRNKNFGEPMMQFGR